MMNFKKKFWKFVERSLPLIGILVLVFIFFWKFFLKNLVPLPGDIIVGAYFPWLDYKWGYGVGVPVYNPIVSDAISFTFPMRTLAIGLLKKGISPLWNNLIFTGAPLLANFQSAPFSPTNIFYVFLGTLNAWSMQVISQHIFGFLFSYMLLRHWDVSKRGSFFGAVAYSFSGFFLIWSQWNAHALVSAFFPLLILFSDRFLLQKKLKDGVFISIVLALEVLSGYPQLVIYSLFSVFVLALFRIKKFNFKNTKTTILLFLFLLLGLLLSAFQLFPGYELISNSQRGGELIPIKWAFLKWKEIITFFAPDYFGNHATGNYWGDKNYLSVTGFVGVVSFIFAAISLKNIKRREIKYLITLTLVSFVLSFPTFIGVFLWKSGLLGLQAGISFRALVLFTLSISLLAGFGMDEFLKSKNDLRKLKIYKILMFLFLIFGYFSYLAFKNPDLVNRTVALRNMILPFGILSASLLGFIVFKKYLEERTVGYLFFLFLMIFELFRFGWKFTPFVPKKLIYPTTPVLDFLESKAKPFRIGVKDVMPVNHGMYYKIEYIGGYDAVYPGDISKYVSVLNSGSANSNPQDRYAIVSNFSSPLFDIANGKYLLVKNDYEYDKNKFKEIFRDKSVVVLENNEAMPRAFMSFDWKIENGEDAFNYLLDENFVKSKEIVLEEKPSIEKSSGAMWYVEYLSYQPDASLMKVYTEKDGMLFVSDTYYPGWKVYVDGNKKKIYKADYAFRAVEIKKGVHNVEFKYEPESFIIGRKVSFLTLVLLGLVYFGNDMFLSFGKRNAL